MISGRCAPRAHASDWARFLLAWTLIITSNGALWAQNRALPTAFRRAVGSFERVEQFAPRPFDLEEVLRQDRQRQGGPFRFAVNRPVDITPDDYGTWERIDDETFLWRLQVTSPDAMSLNLGFEEFFMPPSASVYVYSTDHRRVLGPFTERHNRPHGRLWTPIVRSDDIVIELTVSEAELDKFRLRLTSVNHGYRRLEPQLKNKALGGSGSCNVNVACSQGDPWRDQIRSVAMYQISGPFGSLTCTGTLLNNTAEDNRPYFLTAYHCFDEVDGFSDCFINNPDSVAASIIVYWNNQAETCNGTSGSLSQYQAGSIYRAGYCDSDFALVQLDEVPSSTFNVFYAGWDRSSAAPTSAVAIHHPSSDIKKISFENHPLSVTSFYGTYSPGMGTHLRVPDWDIGTTESGSSGCALFNSARRVVGQLHGGNADCTNNLADWFGRFYRSWDSGKDASTRLKDWLDPIDSGVISLNGKQNGAAVDAYEPDDTYEAASVIDAGSIQRRSIVPAADADWVRFGIEGVSQVVIETSGAAGDTRMRLYDENMIEIDFDDDSGVDHFSRIDRLCGEDALVPGDYYIKVDEYGNNDEIATYDLHLTVTPFSAADLTGDCRVDFADFSVMADQWLTCRMPDYYKVSPLDFAAGDYFGRAVSISGDTAIIGKPYDSYTGTFAGSAYIFQRNGAAWIQLARLEHPDPADRDFFGLSVAVDGDYAIAGVRGEDDLGNGSGAAAIFKRDGLAWMRQDKVRAYDGMPGDYFGQSVSISGDTVIVGAPYDDDRGGSSGSAYVYVRNGASWGFQDKLVASDGAAGDFFGWAVAVSGNVAVIGAYHDDDNGTNSGSAYIFARDSLTSEWVEQVRLLAPGVSIDAAFGTSVAIDGAHVVVGAPGGDGLSPDTGCAYVFGRVDEGWRQQARLVAPDGADGDSFGESVAVDNDIVLVGANANGSAGATYVFARSGSDWTMHSKLTPPNNRAGDEFGKAVAIDDDVALVGAYRDGENGSDTGAAYFLQVNTSPAADIDADNCVDPADLLRLANDWLKLPN